jgi:hypothetical protein
MPEAGGNREARRVRESRRIGRWRSLRSCTVAAASLLAAASAQASDGVVEINQVRALAGGVTASDEPGFPVTLTQGSYRLTSDLDLRGLPGAEDLTAIEARSEDVTIDLNGFSIIGPVQCSGSPRVCAPAGDGVGVITSGGSAVRDGTVTGMGDRGVRAGLGNVIRNVRAISNAGAGIYVAHYSTVMGCTSSFNGGPGIFVSGSGVTVQHSSLKGNGGAGIEIGPGPEGVLIRRNAAANNGLDGVRFTTFTTAAVLSNNLFTNAGRGIEGSPTVGYGSNVIGGNLGGQVNSGTAIAPNLCDGAAACVP